MDKSLVNSELVNALDLASSGDRKSQAEFFRLLLSSEVMVAIKPNSQSSGADGGVDLPIVGNTSLETLGLLTVTHKGKIFLPCFLTPEKFKKWDTEDRYAYISISFTSFLQLLREDHWLHLNPASEVGKEFSPWEIERLREGPEAIEEIINELSSGEPVKFQIYRTDNLYLELKKQLSIAFECYPEILEAFLVELEKDDESNLTNVISEEKGSSVSQNDPETRQLLVGIYFNQLESRRVDQVIEEVKLILVNNLMDNFQITTREKGEQSRDGFWELLENHTPFYFKTGQLDSETKDVGTGGGSAGFYKRIFSKFLKKTS